MDLIISAIICLCIYLVLLIVTVLLKFEDAYKLKGAHFILGVVNSLTMIIICIGLTCLDLQFMINDNNDYLVALYPFIALILQFVLLKIQWVLYNWSRHNKMKSDVGNGVYLLSILLSLFMICCVLYSDKSPLLTWLRCLAYPAVSLLSIYISPDLAFRLNYEKYLIKGVVVLKKLMKLQ